MSEYDQCIVSCYYSGICEPLANLLYIASTTTCLLLATTTFIHPSKNKVFTPAEGIGYKYGTRTGYSYC